MTLFEKIKVMSVEEMAYKAVIELEYFGCFMSLLDTKCYGALESVVTHNMVLLESNVEE